METISSHTLNKRLKIVYLVITLSGFMFLALQLSATWAYWGTVILVLASYLATIIGLDLDLRREEWVVLPLYGVLASIIYYTLASMWIDNTGLAVIAAGGFGLLMYGLILALNIINISTIRTIPLVRPANTVLSMAGLTASFGLYHLALMNQPPLLNWVLAIGGSTFLIAWPLVWISLSSKSRFQKSIVWSSFCAILLMQLAAIVSFWPSSFTSSLILSIVLFLVLGTFHLQQKRQLNQNMKRQYLLLGGVAVAFFILMTQW